LPAGGPAEAAERLIERLERSARVALLGLPGSGKSSILNLLVGAVVVPETLRLPTIIVQHGDVARMICTLTDGTTKLLPGHDLAEVLPLAPALVTLEMDLPALKVISLLEVSAGPMEAEQKRAEIARLESLQRRVDDAISASAKLAPLHSQMRLDMTADGLRIQIVDEQSRPMFDSGSAVVKPYMRELLREIGRVLTEVPNRLTLEGHTDAAGFAAGEFGYSNWELSSDRANASRRELLIGGLPAERVLRVQGLASSVPFDKADPLAAANRRISIIVMNRDAEDRFFDKPVEPAEPSATAGPSAAAPPWQAPIVAQGSSPPPNTR